MKTNFQMIRDLDGFQPMERGFIDIDETALIKSTLCIEEMNELELRNLRDFAVMFYTMKADNSERLMRVNDRNEINDKMSAVVAVIDHELFGRGCEV